MRTQVTKPFLAIILVLVLTATSLMATVSTAEALNLDTPAATALTMNPINSNVTVGVKAGNWMEYTATYTGAADPPEGYPAWFRFQIINVQGTIITANMTYEALNGTISKSSHNYDLKTGVLQLLVIPAGLTYADVFYHQDYGNITISGTEDGSYAGETRTAVYANFDNIEAYWDQYTGVFLDSEQQVLNADNQTVAQKVTISATNLWGDTATASDNSELDQIMFYAKIIVVVAIAAIIVVLILRLMKRRK